jgi:vesicle coat complex subunit
MTARILRGYLQDPDAEIRRAAVLASAMKDLRDHIPLLIERLDDGEPLVVRAAVAALKAMTNQDFGPASGATAEEHKKAVAAWKDWWSRQGDK